MLCVRVNNKVISDPGENIFSEMGVKAREQQDEDQIGSQDKAAANVDKPSIDQTHPLCINKEIGSWILAVWIHLGDLSLTII